MTEKNTKQKNNIFLFHGGNSFSANKELEIWKKLFIKKYDESCLEVIDSENFNQTNFINNLETVPFLSEKRLVIIKNFLKHTNDEIQKEIASKLENIPEFSVLIFYENSSADKRKTLFKKISKIAIVKEFESKETLKIEKILLQEIQEKNIKIDKFTLNYLIEICGLDIWKTVNELNKLHSYSNKEKITKEMINEICIPALSTSIFKLTDALSQHNIKNTLKTLQILIDNGEEINMIFFMIVRQFRILMQVKSLLENGENNYSIIKKLKQNPYVIQLASQQCKNFSIEKMKKIYEELLKIDLKTKTGIIKQKKGDQTEFLLAIEEFAIKCCNKQTL